MQHNSVKHYPCMTKATSWDTSQIHRNYLVHLTGDVIMLYNVTSCEETLLCQETHKLTTDDFMFTSWLTKSEDCCLLSYKTYVSYTILTNLARSGMTFSFTVMLRSIRFTRLSFCIWNKNPEGGQKSMAWQCWTWWCQVRKSLASPMHCIMDKCITFHKLSLLFGDSKRSAV